ncbi:hypothetical protein Tco_0609673, partial [Tanacetum coccineum]
MTVGGGGNDLSIDENCVFVVGVGRKLVFVGLVGRGEGVDEGVVGSL